MSPTDDKQNRLSTLSQDVIAVTKKPASSRAPEGTQERRAIPPSQDVFNVPVAEPPPPPPPRQQQPAPAYRPPSPAAQASSSSSKTVWVALALATIAVGVALYAVRATMANNAPAPADPQVARLESELKLAKDRVQVLEDKLGAAAADTTKSTDSAGQVSLLQVNASLRQLRNDLDHLSNEQAKLSAQLGDVRGQASAAEKEAKAAQGQAAQASSRADAASRQAPAAPAAASADTQAQLKALGQKTDKMATDIRQLYRLLENH